MRARPAREWLAALEPAGVPCGPINDLAQVFEDPQVRHRRMQVTAPHPAAGAVRMVASPMKLSETPVTYEVGPPLLGEHTREVLEGILGLDPAEVERLRREGVV
jgi:crotonobetainyl-CoA:carnitine CoA-transferase CaiB-like acyl-CoA transferase